MEEIILNNEDGKVTEKHKKVRKTVSPWVAKHKDLCKELHETYVKKNSDYKGSFHETYKQFGIVSALTRITDKYNRIINLAQNDNYMVKNESLRDTCLDLAGYLIMTVMELDTNEKRRARIDR